MRVEVEEGKQQVKEKNKRNERTGIRGGEDLEQAEERIKNRWRGGEREKWGDSGRRSGGRDKTEEKEVERTEEDAGGGKVKRSDLGSYIFFKCHPSHSEF